MKKINIVLILINILCGLLIFSNYFFIFNFSNISIPLALVISIFYLIVSIIFIKQNKKLEKIDIITNSIYYIFLIFMLIFSVIYQANNNETFNMMYFTKFLIIPHLIMILYNIKKTQ